MSDVLLAQESDGGEICIEGGLVVLIDGFETAAYLSLFGGNEDDDGRDDNPLSWWGNIDETDPSRIYVSETQHLIDILPPTSSNLLRLEDAATRDLQWFLDVNAAIEVLVEVSIPRLNSVRFVITINGDETVEFIENWKAAE